MHIECDYIIGYNVKYKQIASIGYYVLRSNYYIVKRIFIYYLTIERGGEIYRGLFGKASAVLLQVMKGRKK